jgi:hypothetical protein
MQINSNSNGFGSHRFDLPQHQGFRPITKDDLTLSGIMRRISEMNLGSKVDLQA